jgi:hypothetical protein
MEVTIAGTGFIGITAVTFNGTAATNFTVDSPIQIRARVPNGASTGKIGVSNPAGTALSPTDFTVTVSSISEFTFTPQHDAYVRSVSPTNNYGKASTLRIEGGSEQMNVFLKFEVAGLDGPVQNAKLRLFVVNASNEGGSVYAVSNNYSGSATPWAEQGLMWSNAPVIGGTALGSAGPVNINDVVEFDVTSVIAGNGIYSFGVKSNSSDRAYYSSKEDTIAPKLIIQTASGLPIVPSIFSFMPASGVVGTEVTIVGDGFEGTTQVIFNGTTATNFSVVSQNELRSIVPAGATTGKIGVTNPAGTTQSATDFMVSSSLFVFTPAHDAYVRSVSPTNNYGAAGTLRIEGGSEQMNVFLKFAVAGLDGPVQRAKLRLYVANASNDGGSVYVVSNNQQGTATPWAETNLNWNNAPVISGTALSTAGPVNLDSSIELDVTAAITGEGTYSFGLTSNSSDRAYYNSKEGTNPPELVIETASSTPTTPSITSFTPNSGPVGTEVTITGSGFSGTTGVTFNGTAATSFSVVSFTQLRATVPNSATSGKINVTNTVGNASSGEDFMVTILTHSTFNPVADAEVKSSSPTDNYGSFNIFRLRDGSVKYNSYLRFNVSGLAGTVNRAKLRLFVTEASDDGGRVYAVANNYSGSGTAWDESGLNWNNAPALGATALNTAGAVTAGTVVEFDVTAAIAGNGIYSFGLASGSTTAVKYSSKEGANPPELIIEVISGATAKMAASASAEGGTGDEQLLAAQPESMMLYPSHPNPLRLSGPNPQTRIVYQLVERATVKLAVYDLLGRELRVLANIEQSPGRYQVKWDGRDRSGNLLPSGAYIYRIQAGNLSIAKTLLVVK